MLRCYYLISSLSVIFVFAANSLPAFSTPLTPNYRYPKVQDSQTNKPLCYIQIADGTTLDLQKLCGKSLPTKSNLGSRIAKSQFRQGTGKAYANDSQ